MIRGKLALASYWALFIIAPLVACVVFFGASVSKWHFRAQEGALAAHRVLAKLGFIRPLDTLMTLDQFWNIVEKVHRESGGDMDRKCELLDAELRRLSLEEVRSFHGYFDQCQDRAYTWELWAAAYIIGGGCSDDAFSDFRATLVSMGRQTFELALADPQSLADMDYDADTAHYEGYQYVPTTVESDLGVGQQFPRYQPHPAEPSGKPWDEDKVAELYPKLAAKYDYNG